MIQHNTNNIDNIALIIYYNINMAGLVSEMQTTHGGKTCFSPGRGNHPGTNIFIVRLK